jgi:hypothetical protein
VVLPNFRHQNQYAVGSQQLKILVALRAGYVRIARVDGFQVGAQKLADHYSIARCDALYEPTGLSVGELQSRFQTILGMIGSF